MTLVTLPGTLQQAGNQHARNTAPSLFDESREKCIAKNVLLGFSGTTGHTSDSFNSLRGRRNHGSPRSPLPNDAMSDKVSHHDGRREAVNLHAALRILLCHKFHQPNHARFGRGVSAPEGISLFPRNGCHQQSTAIASLQHMRRACLIIKKEHAGSHCNVNAVVLGGGLVEGWRIGGPTSSRS